jgi:hypothetical protein
MSPQAPDATNHHSRAEHRDWNVARIASTTALFATLYAAIILMKHA